MVFSIFALAAAAATHAAAPQAAPKWVSLQAGHDAQNAPVEPAPQASPAPSAPTPSAQQATVPLQSTPAPEVAQATPADPHRPLALTCVGGGTASKATSAFGWGYGGWGMVSGHKDRGFSEQVDLRLFMGDDRIRMPRTMLPGLHGGSDGWFKVHDLVADARAIHASAGVGLLNNPKIYIDRVTGTISISGKSGDYAGQCQVIDPSAAAKF